MQKNLNKFDLFIRSPQYDDEDGASANGVGSGASEGGDGEGAPGALISSDHFADDAGLVSDTVANRDWVAPF